MREVGIPGDSWNGREWSGAGWTGSLAQFPAPLKPAAGPLPGKLPFAGVCSGL
jgi:hypothetical protein